MTPAREKGIVPLKIEPVSFGYLNGSRPSPNKRINAFNSNKRAHRGRKKTPAQLAHSAIAITLRTNDVDVEVHVLEHLEDRPERIVLDQSLSC